MDFMEFKDEAAELLNLNLDGYKLKRVKRRTNSLMRRQDVDDYEECLKLLETDSEFRSAYMNHFTINTSEFFRNPDSFQYMREEILPDLISNQKNLKIWSAPCSNGSEPYTIAIQLLEMGVDPGRFTLLASDIDPGILKTASRGVFPAKALKNMSEYLKEKYFSSLEEHDDRYQLSQEIIDLVEFEKKDLINDSYRSGWDLILSRNFFIYLTRELKEELTEKFVSALRPGGYLFLGNTEFIFNPGDYDLDKVHLSFYRKQR